jgi:hypothetical protein
MSDSRNWPLRIIVILVVVAISSVFAVGIWYGLAYLGMTVIICLDYTAHVLSWMGVGPAGAWLILGCFLGGVVGGARAFNSFGRKKEAWIVTVLALAFCLLFWPTSFAVTAFVENRATERAAAARNAQEEAVRRRAREAEEKAMLDKAWTEGRLWRIASITNQTGGKIPFTILNGKGNWDEYSVRPGATMTVWEKVRDLTIRFDYSYADGYQEKRYTLGSTPIIGREPNKTDQARAKASSFRANGRVFDLYQN